MKVLITSEYNHPNSVIKSYFDGLFPYCELVGGITNFWSSSIKFDIIHIQWPEELFYSSSFTNQDLQLLEEKLKYWKKNNVKLVITRHNEFSSKSSELSLLHELCYNYADAVVHLGEYSLNEFNAHPVYSSKENVLIRHPNYFNITNNVPKEKARQRFKFKEDDIVFLSFGAIRNERQQNDLIKAFKKLKLSKKKLILTNSLYLKKIVAFRASPIRNLSYKIEKLLLKRNNIVIDETRNIGNSIIQYYFNAADVIVLPRIKQLNSGIPYLAFSFSKIVVGPDVANIGELLNQTGNSSYKPLNIDSYANALAQSVRLLSTDVGNNNFKFACTECDIYSIGKQHTMLYARLIDLKEKV